MTSNAPIKARLYRAWSPTCNGFVWFVQANHEHFRTPLYMGRTEGEARSALATWNAARTECGLAPLTLSDH